MARTLTIVAVGLIVLGAVTMVGPTFGFSTVASDRGVSVSTAEDDQAYIALIDESPDDGFPNNDFETAASLANNLDGTANVEYDISVDDDEVEVEFDGEEGSSITGETYIEDSEEIDLNCGSPGQRDSDIVTMSVEIDQATSNGVTVQDANMELMFDCEDGEVADPVDTEFFDTLEAYDSQGNIQEVTVDVEVKQDAELDIEVQDVDGDETWGDEGMYEEGDEEEIVIDIDNTNPVDVVVTASDPDGTDTETCEGRLDGNDGPINLDNGGFDCE